VVERNWFLDPFPLIYPNVGRMLGEKLMLLSIGSVVFRKIRRYLDMVGG